ncbi:MAG: hypothetical protein HY317_02205 [Acidobacteria bacterium]|nr:hypothetical protein [Acidobacteriota bacterium]
MRASRPLWVFLIPLVPLVQIRVDGLLERPEPRDEILYLRTGRQLKRLVPGFEYLLADVYWLRTVQYFGRERLFSKDQRYELLHPLIEITTDLDPRLRIAYKYGAIFLCERRPVGKGDPEAGIRILEKGVRNLPRDWRLRQDLGYFRYLFLGDAKGGAAVLLEAARLPGAAFWLASLAETMLDKSADRGTAREIWRRTYEQEEEGFLKDNALDNLRRLDALDAVESLNAAVERFRKRQGRPPRDSRELAADPPEGGRLADPTGVPFAYDPQEGRFAIARESRLWRGGK